MLFTASCSIAKPGPLATSTPRPSPTPFVPTLRPTQTRTPLPPTPTPEPLAARVNQDGITLAEYEAQLARYQQSGTNLATLKGMTDQQFVLQEMISEVLLAQKADQEGFTISDEALQERMDALAAKVNLEEWMSANLYSEEQFRAALRRSLSAAWARDQIAAQVPLQTEQVHVRQILLYNLDDANLVLSSLQNGQDFNTLARRYDPATGGELGWIARNTLAEKNLEDAAFNLQPGAYSQIVETSLGYHILFLVEREAERSLEPEALQKYQEQAVTTWIENQKQASQIEIFVP